MSQVTCRGAQVIHTKLLRNALQGVALLHDVESSYENLCPRRLHTISGKSSTPEMSLPACHREGFEEICMVTRSSAYLFPSA